MLDFLNHFYFGKGLFRFSIGSVKESDTQFRKGPPTEVPTDTDVYFAPAVYKTSGLDKTDVLGTIALWSDCDDTDEIPHTLLPPTFVVRSGHGMHLYWLLTEPVMSVELIEHLNKIVTVDIGDESDSCWNANRVLRIPGTLNTKNPDQPVQVKLIVNRPSVKYDSKDVQALGRIDPTNIGLIKTGSTKGFKSASERDWRVISDLAACGVSYEMVYTIFKLNPIGSKIKDEDDKYLKHTYENAHNKKGLVAGKKDARKHDAAEIVAREDGYYRGNRRLSTFTFDPTLLLDATGAEVEDALVGDVTANDYTWKGVTFSRRAFTHMQQLDRECPVAAWQWMGYEQDLRALLPFLMDKLRDKGLPRVRATPIQGLHAGKDGAFYFVGNSETLSSDQYWSANAGPMAWLPSKREHPTLNLTVVEPTQETKDFLINIVPMFNDPGVMWPMIGWFAASPVKPWLEKLNRRFPVLNVTGTRGSGKSTLIQRVLMPLLGQAQPKAFDAGTTRFVTLSLMGSTNAIPISFSEYRTGNDTTEGFLRYIRLSYDTGHDPRGKADQTTVDYPLSAPFCVDGEDLISDPACQERIIVAHLKPASVAEGGVSYEAFTKHRNKVPNDYAGYYIQQAMKRVQDGRAEELLQKSYNAMFGAYPNAMPDRVRNNHIIAYFGVLMWCDVLGSTPPPPTVMLRSLGSVCNMGTGKSRSMGDLFVEALVDEIERTKTNKFKWSISDTGTVVYVQLTSAHSWWTMERRRQGKPLLEVDAIKNQLKESAYYAGIKLDRGATLFGIDLPQAVLQGLDVVDSINVISMEINL